MSDNTKPARSADDVKLVEKTERCVEHVLKKTTIGALAPLGLLLVTSKLKFIGTCMVFGAGVGLGMATKDCCSTSSCASKANCHSKFNTSTASSTNNDCKTGTCPVKKPSTPTPSANTSTTPDITVNQSILTPSPILTDTPKSESS